MRLIRKGTLRKVTVGVFFSACLYTVWTNYNAHSNNVLVLKKEIINEQASLFQKAKNTSTTSNLVISKPISTQQSTVTVTNSSNILIAYQKRWVGFEEIYRSDCKTALATKVNNSVFPSEVKRVYPAQIILDCSDCTSFIEKYGFRRYPAASEEERQFPIAFIILFYKDLDQVLFLLRALYHPHNVYCLSLDIKASIEFMEAVKSVTRCLLNVFVASKLENIVYAGFTRLMADINCMNDLLKHPAQWKYVINMPGQEFPLRTNLELVRILQKYNGANDVEGLTGNRMVPHRYQFKHKYVADKKTGEISMVRTSKKHEPPPHNISVVKGSAYGAFSRAFVQFVVYDPIAKDVLEWTKEVNSPDEYFWATLHHSATVAVPGGYTGNPNLKPWLTAYASWGGRDPCTTIRTRGICIFSPSDLPHLMERHEMFANKFYITHHPAVLHCLDQLLFNLTFTGSTRNLTYYNSLPFALKFK
ncbi:hypothetical protein BsWGS_06492 [Bradybaena similaris]